MLLDYIQQPQTWNVFLHHPVWRQAFSWIDQSGKVASSGEHEIEGKDLYASVIQTSTQPREERLFENHDQYIDLHYCLEGGEVIEWTPVSSLTKISDQNADKDYTLYKPIDTVASLHMTRGYFVVFFPGDAHMPQIHDGIHSEIHKIVIKINTHLIH